MSRRLSKIRFLLVFFSVICICITNALADCPLKISKIENDVTLIESNLSNYKIEKQWIKQQVLNPFDKPWDYANLGNGAAHIEGRFSSNGEIFSQFYAVQKNGVAYWYLLVKDRLGWVAASQAGNEFTCTYVNDAQSLMRAMKETFSKHSSLSEARLVVDDPKKILANLDLQ